MISSHEDLERGERQPLLSGSNKPVSVRERKDPSSDDGAFQRVPNKILRNIISFLNRDAAAFARTNTRLRTQTELTESYVAIRRELSINRAQNQLKKIEGRKGYVRNFSIAVMGLALFASTISLLSSDDGEDCYDLGGEYTKTCLEEASNESRRCNAIALSFLIIGSVTCFANSFYSRRSSKKEKSLQDQIEKNRNTVLNV